MTRLFLALTALLLTACTGTSTEPPATDLTFYGDIQPMVQTYCTRCHYTDGPGPLDFTDPQVVEEAAELMATAVDDGRMPPPASDPACVDYEGSERFHMPNAQKDLLREWVDGGKPMGDPATANTAPEIELTLPDADLEIRLKEPYTPTYSDPANPGNEYRCFILDPERDEDFYITGLAPIIDAQPIVHHIVLFSMDRADIPADYTDQGYDCIDDDGAVSGMVGGWAPGAVPVRFDEGGVRISSDQVLVMQMHYFQSVPEPLTDQSGYQFTTSDEGPFIRMLPIGSFDFNIPAGEEEHVHADSFRNNFGLAIEAVGVFPHMHVLGSGYRMWLERADGSTQCMAESEDYDFDNQITYEFKEPIRIEDGDVVRWECVWNNSTSNPNLIHDPPQDTRYGERTDEEMCFFFTLGGLAP